MAFVPKHTDFALSPYTGLTRESWLEAAKYLLENVFSRIGGFDAPVVVPRVERNASQNSGVKSSNIAIRCSLQ